MSLAQPKPCSMQISFLLRDGVAITTESGTVDWRLLVFCGHNVVQAAHGKQALSEGVGSAHV